MADLAVVADSVEVVSGIPTLTTKNGTTTAGTVLSGNNGAPAKATDNWGVTLASRPMAIALDDGSAVHPSGLYVVSVLLPSFYGIDPWRTVVSIVDLGVATVNNRIYYLSYNAGKICTYEDLRTNDWIVIIGIGLGGSRLRFQPINTSMKK